MTRIRGVDTAATAMQARLTAGLPADLVTVNAAITDGYTLDNPFEVLDYLPPIKMIVNFPTIGILVGGAPGTFEDDTGWSATGKYVLSIVTVIQDADQVALNRKLRRYNASVANVALANRNLGSGSGVPWGMTLRGLDWGPTMAKVPNSDQPPETWWSYATCDIEIKLDEE